MQSVHSSAFPLVAGCMLAALGFATSADAQPYGPSQGGGGMMGGAWDWGMGYGMGGGISVLLLTLLVLGVAVVMFRRRSP